MQYLYPQQYIFIPSDWASGLASGIFIISSVALFVMLRKMILNYYQKKGNLLVLSNLIYAIGISAFLIDSIVYIRWKVFLDEYLILSLLSVIIGTVIVLGVPKVRIVIIAFSALILALVPINIPLTSPYIYFVMIKYVPLGIYIIGVISLLLVMFHVTRVYGPLSLSISLIFLSFDVFIAFLGVTLTPFLKMELYTATFSFFIASGLFGSEKTSVSGIAKTVAAYVTIGGIGFTLYAIRISVPLAITLGGIILFSGIAAYFSTVFDAKYYKFKDNPSLMLSLGDLAFSITVILLIPDEIISYNYPLPFFMNLTLYRILVFEFLLTPIILFAIASLIITKKQLYISLISFLAGVNAALAVVALDTYLSLIIFIDVIVFSVPTLIFLYFGYKLYRTSSPGASVTLSTGITLLLYILAFGMLFGIAALTLVQSILFLFLSIITTLLLFYGIIILPASKSRRVKS